MQQHSSSKDWIRYKLLHTPNADPGFGVLRGKIIEVYRGNMFDAPSASEETLELNQVELLTPCMPGKMLGLWNNFYSRAAKEGWDIPAEPLYFIKANSSYLAHGQSIRRPQSYSGPIFFEGELGIVIGKTCSNISEQVAADHIFGYTCVNDVTAKEILKRDPSFPQWVRAKGFDTFGVFGPSIATGIDPSTLVVQSRLDGELKQDYSVSDMIFQPQRLVSLISRDITLHPGDVIACGTGLDAEAMQNGQTLEVFIEGVGCLSNRMGDDLQG